MKELNTGTTVTNANNSNYPERQRLRLATTTTTKDTDLSSMQDDLKKINKYLKLGEIDREIKVLEITRCNKV